jgi:hypothetical protein
MVSFFLSVAAPVCVSSWFNTGLCRSAVLANTKKMKVHSYVIQYKGWNSLSAAQWELTHAFVSLLNILEIPNTNYFLFCSVLNPPPTAHLSTSFQVSK